MITPKKREKILSEVQERLAAGIKADEHNRSAALSDLKFKNGDDQWDSRVKREREVEGRPTLVFNQLPVFVDQVLGDQRESRPATKIHPVDNKGSVDSAKILEGLVRSIKYLSKADVAHDTAFQQAVDGGFGYWRVLTEYDEDSPFVQNIKIVPIADQMSVVFDPSAEQWDKTDAEWLFLYRRISNDVFAKKFPGKDPTPLQIKGVSGTIWYDKSNVTVAEYFKKKRKKVKMFQLLPGGEIVDQDKIDQYKEEGRILEELPEEGIPPGMWYVAQKREIDSYTIVRYLVCGHDILEDETEWPSKFWPVVPVWGKETNIQGKRYLRGLLRFAKDPQKAYNLSRNSEIEQYAMLPKAPKIVTPRMLEGHEEAWKNANKRVYPFLYVNPDPEMPGWPQDSIPPQVSTALAHSTATAREELKHTIGIFSPHMEKIPGNVPDRAFKRILGESDVGTYEFIDNLARALELEDRILIELIPHIYDTERVIRIRDIDGTTNPVEINKPVLMQNPQNPSSGPIERVLNDLTVGRYDVVVTMGPAYSTARAEAVEHMMELIRAAPNIAPFIVDKLAKSMDFQDAEVIANRLKAGVVPKTVMTPQELQTLPPSALKPPINPMMMARIQKDIAMAQKALADAEKSKAQAGHIQAEKTIMAMEALQNLAMSIMGQGPGQQRQQDQPGGLPQDVMSPGSGGLLNG